MSISRSRAGLALLATLPLIATASVAPSYAAPNQGRGHQAPVASAAGAFVRTATFPAYLNTSISDVAVAEISTVTKDGNTVIYTDAGGKRIGFVDIRDINAPKPLGSLEVGGEPTSVYATADHILVCVDTTAGDFTNPSGKMLVLDVNTRKLVRTIDLGGQPDSIDITADGKFATVAIENQRDEEFTPEGLEEGDIPQAPTGWLSVLHLDGPASTWTMKKIDVTGLPGMVAPTDAEPEYVKISPDGKKIALTLQENNHIVIAGLKNHKVLTSFTAGENTVEGVDTKKDKVIDPTKSITKKREPDSIGWIDNRYVATANEGDWQGGSRGWSIFDTQTGKVVWDAGNTFEQLAIVNGHWNEGRAAKKGTEPEGLAIATFGGVRYAFVGSERSNFVAVYDVSTPTAPKFVQMLPSTNGPEGLLPIPSRNLLVVSSEVDEAENNIRGTVQLYAFGEQKPAYPQITGAEAGIGWGALGALTADKAKPGLLYSATDAAYVDTRILTIDATQSPAQITKAMPVTKDGEQASYDVEGLWLKPEGGFWLGVEGAKGAGNMLVETDASGAVLREVTLPASYTDKLGKQGIEGVTGNADGSVLYFAMQREAKGEDVTRIGRYDVATGALTWYGYRLESPSVDGDWIGLSEIQLVDADTIAVIERDKLNGPAAAIKRIYTADLVGEGVADGEKLPVLEKKLAYDVLGDLQGTKGWTQEKLEGMTIDAARNVYVITDNDAVDDNNGETVFLNLGKVLG